MEPIYNLLEKVAQYIIFLDHINCLFACLLNECIALDNLLLSLCTVVCELHGCDVPCSLTPPQSSLVSSEDAAGLTLCGLIAVREGVVMVSRVMEVARPMVG
jgi:hypothetical protein